MATSNAEYLIELLKALEPTEFEREDLFPNDKDAASFSPYLTYCVGANLLERVRRGRYRKTELLNKPTSELVPLLSFSHRKNVAPKPKQTTTEQQYCEHDIYDILDQLPIERLLDVVAAKWNTLAALAEPLKRDAGKLQDLVMLKDNELKSLKVELLRAEEKQKQLNNENNRLTALFSNSKKERLILAKPVNAAGNVTFKEGDDEHRRIKIYRKA
jgi:hypothetical protein